MDKLTKQQTEKANKLLGLLCESNTLNNVQVASFFDNDDEAVFVCKYLEINDLLKATWPDGNRIASIDKREKTCNAFETDLLMKEFKKENPSSISKQLKIIGGF